MQHSNNIFATCNSALLPLHEKADLLSILQGYNTVAPVGSQFFIVQANTTDPSLISQMKGLPDVFGDEVAAKYEEVGGTPWLDYHHTVFGQVIKGMDVVDAIAGVATDGRDMPLDDVIIENIEFKTFGELSRG